MQQATVRAFTYSGDRLGANDKAPPLESELEGVIVIVLLNLAVFVPVEPLHTKRAETAAKMRRQDRAAAAIELCLRGGALALDPRPLGVCLGAGVARRGVGAGDARLWV